MLHPPEEEQQQEGEMQFLKIIFLAFF